MAEHRRHRREPAVSGACCCGAVWGTYVDTLFGVFQSRVPHEADFACYWHEKAREKIAAGETVRAGLLANESIRVGANRRLLERIKTGGDIFLAWSDEPWVLAGAGVRISFVGFDNGSETDRMLDGHPVTQINANLTAGIDLNACATSDREPGHRVPGSSQGAGPSKSRPRPRPRCWRHTTQTVDRIEMSCAPG